MNRFDAITAGSIKIVKSFNGFGGHSLGIKQVNIFKQLQNIGVLVEVADRRFDIGPIIFIDGNQPLRVNELNQFGAGFGLVNMRGGKIIDLVVLVGDVENRIFNVQFFKFSGPRAGDIKFEVAHVLFEGGKNQQQAD